MNFIDLRILRIFFWVCMCFILGYIIWLVLVVVKLFFNFFGINFGKCILRIVWVDGLFIKSFNSFWVCDFCFFWVVIRSLIVVVFRSYDCWLIMVSIGIGICILFVFIFIRFLKGRCLRCWYKKLWFVLR